MTKEQVIELLRAIYRLALLPYPFPEGTEIDPRLAMALGEIAGIANRVLAGRSPLSGRREGFSEQ